MGENFCRILIKNSTKKQTFYFTLIGSLCRHFSTRFLIIQCLQFSGFFIRILLIISPDQNYRKSKEKKYSKLKLSYELVKKYLCVVHVLKNGKIFTFLSLKKVGNIYVYCVFLSHLVKGRK